MNYSTQNVHQKAVCKAFGFLKSPTSLDVLLARSLQIPNGEGLLVPICSLHLDDDQLIKDLATWRAANQNAYPTRFPVTIEGTSNWLSERLLAVEDRILFLVLDKYGYRIGHAGFANCFNDNEEMEIDNVVRGVKDASPGIMQSAVCTLINWARTTIGAESFPLRVFSDNLHAIKFYERCGFSATDTIQLRHSIYGEVENFSTLDKGDVEPPDASFIRMEWAAPEYTGEKMIATAGPSISERESAYATDAARTGWNSKWSDYLSAFEKEFSSYIGSQHCLATSSCTGALHIALAALGIGEGDEVIVPDITWVATANAVRYVGATPVFADIEDKSWCLDPVSFERKISPRTKAVVAVHLYGHPARMDLICSIARAHGLKIVEDAAPAIGAEWKGRKTGSFGDFACFSFQGAKLLVTGEGGMLSCNDSFLYEKALKIWDQGRNPSRTFWIDDHGLKYKMSNIQAALGLAQIERCDEQIKMKRRIFDWYSDGLKDCAHLKMVPEVEDARSIYWMSNCRLAEASPVTRDALRAELMKRNIDTRPVFPAISQYPIWNAKTAPQPTAQLIANSGINLPSGVCLTRHEVAHVCNSLRAILGEVS